VEREERRNDSRGDVVTRSLESDKVCDYLDIESRILYCKKLRAEDRHHRLSAAPCMMDTSASAYIQAEFCEGYHTGGNKGNDATTKANG
jgi:hypothetical protein